MSRVNGRSRSYWLSLAVLAYVCVGAAQASHRILPWIGLGVLPLLLAEVWRRTQAQRTHDHIDPRARSALRACVWGVLVWTGARLGPTGNSALDAAANLGIGTASVAALVALARIRPLGGLLTTPRACESLDAAGFTALLWGIAVAVPATHALVPAPRLRLDPLAIDYATTAASVGTLLVFVAASFRLRALRSIELGAGDRAAGALALSMTGFLVAIPAAALDVAAPDRVLPCSIGLTSILCAWAATTPEPTTVASALRGVLAIAFLGTPTTLATGLAARHAPEHASAIVLVGSSVAIAVGLIARAVARPLGPEQSRWLEAIEAASRGALQPEPDAALRAALVELSKTCSTPGTRPQIWRNSPEDVLSVDIAGYLHVEKEKAPERLYELAIGEPERTLRAEALRSLEVRRPEVRPLIAWFETHAAFSATLILDEDGPIGFILLPAANRTSSMTLEEARAVRILADRISALLSVSSALARSRERELAAAERADRADDECQRLEHIISGTAERHTQNAERAARPVRTTAYSAAARFALDRLEQLGKRGSPLVLKSPPGVDAIGWAAHAHLASPRAGGPFVVVDATNPAEQAPEHWENPTTSPLALADGGTLVLLDIVALPAETQEQLAQALSRQSSMAAVSSVLRANLITVVRRPLADLSAEGRVMSALLRWLGDSEVELPSLFSRAEDLRSLCLDALARFGLSMRGEPFGIEPGALRLLQEHTWPGNDVELTAVLIRACSIGQGRAITEQDLVDSGFQPSSAPVSEFTPPPSIAERRLRSRRAPRGR